jgi:hypothetical protein
MLKWLWPNEIQTWHLNGGTDHSGRAVLGINCLLPLKYWVLCVRIQLEAWMSVCVYSVVMLSCVGSGLESD